MMLVSECCERFLKECAGAPLWPFTHRNWLLGRGLPTGKELYSKMVDEADDMIMAMEEGREVDILQEVMKYSGMEAGEH